MAARAKITSKNQITLPREVRAVLHVGVGDVVEFDADEHGVHVRAHARVSPFAGYRGIARRGQGLRREQVLRALDELRGHDDDDTELLAAWTVEA